MLCMQPRPPIARPPLHNYLLALQVRDAQDAALVVLHHFGKQEAEGAETHFTPAPTPSASSPPGSERTVENVGHPRATAPRSAATLGVCHLRPGFVGVGSVCELCGGVGWAPSSCFFFVRPSRRSEEEANAESRCNTRHPTKMARTPLKINSVRPPAKQVGLRNVATL